MVNASWNRIHRLAFGGAVLVVTKKRDTSSAGGASTMGETLPGSFSCNGVGCGVSIGLWGVKGGFFGSVELDDASAEDRGSAAEGLEKYDRAEGFMA